MNIIGQGKVKNYLLYAIGEILLVMIGILLAIQVNNWNEANIEKKESVQFYQNFKRQISEDQRMINGTINYNKNYINQFLYAIKVIEEDTRSEVDTLGYIALKLTKYSDFDRASNIYESIVNSGDLRLLKNKIIAKKIQVLEESYMYFNRMESIHYDLIFSIVPELVPIIKYSNRTVLEPDKLFSVRFQNIFINSVNVMNEKDDVYNRAISQISEIMDLIDEELTLLDSK